MRFLPLVVGLLLATPAYSQQITATPDDIVPVLQAEGLMAKVGKDDDGDPQIRTKSQGINWLVSFYGCTKGEKCKTVQFGAWFTAKPDRISTRQIEEWNVKWRWIKAVRKGDDVIATMDVNLTGGVPAANFTESLRLWDSVLGSFLRHIDW
jgi:hypothetical protein